MSKYISQYTEQTATQSTDKYLFQRGLTYYHITNANLVTSLTSSLNLAQYLTITSAASTYVPLTRELTINGVTYDLSANRSWTISAGVTGSGTTNYVSKWTSSSALGDSLIYDNGTNVGIGTASPSYKLDVNGTIRGTNVVVGNPSAAVAGLHIYGGINGYGNITMESTTNHKWEFAVSNTSFQINATPASNAIFYWDYTNNWYPLTMYNGKIMMGGVYSSVPAINAALHVQTNSGDTLYTKGSTADTTAFAAKFENSGSSNLASIRNDYLFTLGAGQSTGQNWLRVNGANADLYIGQSASTRYGYTTGNVAIIENNGNAPLVIGTVNNNEVIIAKTGIAKWILDTSSRFGFNKTSSLTATVHIYGADNNGSTYSPLQVDTATVSNVISCTSDGKTGFGVLQSNIASWARVQIGDGPAGANWLRIYGSGSDINIGQSSGTLFGYATATAAIIEHEAATPLVIGTYAQQELVFGTYNTVRAKIGNGGNFDLVSGVYKIGGTSGFTGTGAYTNFTIVGGIITNAS